MKRTVRVCALKVNDLKQHRFSSQFTQFMQFNAFQINIQIIYVEAQAAMNDNGYDFKVSFTLKEIGADNSRSEIQATQRASEVLFVRCKYVHLHTIIMQFLYANRSA